MNHYTKPAILLAAMLLLFACKKNDNPEKTPDNLPPTVMIDDITGTYIGMQKHHKIDYAYAPYYTYHRDTTYTTADTLTITKISADSFELSDNSWQLRNGKPLHFAFDTANVYAINYEYYDQKDTLTIRFNAATDSMVVYKYNGSPGSSGYHFYRNYFYGRK